MSTEIFIKKDEVLLQKDAIYDYLIWICSKDITSLPDSGTKVYNTNWDKFFINEGDLEHPQQIYLEYPLCAIINGDTAYTSKGSKVYVFEPWQYKNTSFILWLNRCIELNVVIKVNGILSYPHRENEYLPCISPYKDGSFKLFEGLTLYPNSPQDKWIIWDVNKLYEDDFNSAKCQIFLKIPTIYSDVKISYS